MVILLYNKFNEISRGGMSEMTDLDRINILLLTAEKAGMLPPKAQIPIQVNGSETYITDYCWEKE